MTIKDFLNKLQLEYVDEKFWWVLYEDGEEIGMGRIRASFRYRVQRRCRELGIEYEPRVHTWVEKEEKKIPDAKRDPSLRMFEYFPTGLVELNKELDRELEKMEREKKKKEKEEKQRAT